MDFETIGVDREEEISFITLNRPESRNAIDMKMRKELVAAIDEIDEDKEARVLVITGAGSSFCSGGDVKTMAGLDLVGRKERIQILHEVITKIQNIEKPVIAAVNGVAFGAGCSLVMASDLVIASEEASFSQAFLKVGLVPDCGAMFFLPRLLGLARTKELFFTGDVLDARRAEELGLINRVVPADSLMSEVKAMAHKLISAAPLAMGLTKKILHKAMETSLSALLDYEVYAQGLCMQTEDHQEGIRAFKEKRGPKFVGR